MDERRKVFVEVLMKHGADGKKTPQSITFEDGKQYPIDRLIAVKRAAATKVGGGGIRYTISVSGRQTFLFEDDGRFFVEAKNLHA